MLTPSEARLAEKMAEVSFAVVMIVGAVRLITLFN